MENSVAMSLPSSVRPVLACLAGLGLAGCVYAEPYPPPPVYAAPPRVYAAPPPVYAPPPAYYGRPRGVWVPGHYNRWGRWVPGHWR